MGKINKLGLILLFGFLSGLIYAYEVPPKNLQKWTATKTYTTKRNGKTIARAKVFRRFIDIGGYVYPIGRVTFNQYKKNKRDSLPADFAGKLKAAMGGVNWQVRRNKNDWVITGDLPGANRSIRYQIIERPKSIAIAIATYRMGYADSVAPEAEMIQKAMLATSGDKKYFSWLQFLSPVQIAYGQTFHPGVNTSINPPGGQAGPPGGFFTGAINTQQNVAGINSTRSTGGSATIPGMVSPMPVLGGMPNIRTPLSGVNGTGNAINNALLGSTLQMNRVNNNLGASNAIVNSRWQDSNEIMDRNMQAAIEEYSRSNDLAEKFAASDTLLTFAAATSASAVLGANLMNLAIDGVVSGVRWAKELITDAKGERERWQKFTQAREAWEKSLAVSRKLEKMLDDFLTSQSIMQQIQKTLDPEERQKLSREQLIAHLSFQLRRAKKSQNKFEKLFTDAEENSTCERYYNRELVALEKFINENKAVHAFLQKRSFKVYNNDLFCNYMQKIVLKLGEAEASIQDHRWNLLNAKEQWVEKNDKNHEKNLKIVQRQNKKSVKEKYRDKRIDHAKTVYRRTVENLKARKERFIANCIAEYQENNNSFFLEEDDIFDGDDAPGTVPCLASYPAAQQAELEGKLQVELQARDEKIAAAKHDYRQSLGRHLEHDNSVENLKQAAYYKWFSDLEEQQYCATHREDKGCLHAAESKFMGAFYQLGEAQVKLKNICGRGVFEY